MTDDVGRRFSMTDRVAADPPSAFIARWSAQLQLLLGPGARALDVAAGRGRHSLALAASGFRVTAIDNRCDALTDLMGDARHGRLLVAAICADLTLFPIRPSTFDLIVVSRYLDRERMPSLLAGLSPGGVLVYETFTQRQLQHGRGPRSPAHLLAPGELRLFVRGMEVLFDEEVTEPDALARIVARKGGRVQPCATSFRRS
jgi:SAM-dependent methyltransferase